MKEGPTDRVRYRPLQFFIIDFALTWGPLWIAVAGIRNGWLQFNFLFMGIAGASALPVALFMIYTSGSRKLVRDFWRRVLDPRLINGFWWAVIVLSVPAIMGTAILIRLSFGGSLEELRLEEQFLAGPLFFILLHLLYGPLPEELGWRGYGIDALRSRMSGFWTSIVFGIIWPLWHLPLFFIPGSYQAQLLSQPLPLIMYVVSMIPQAVLMNCVYFHTNRSVISAVALHFMINFIGEAFHWSQETKVVESLLFFVVAVVILVVDRKTFFTKST